mmetsp:Transcript_71319/g.212727  ORF Transcript_71319/g.212727 Transcript_71319/m.212727 type:complete len:214 (+) Transcript_71319:371-1012(+)
MGPCRLVQCLTVVGLHDGVLLPVQEQHGDPAAHRAVLGGAGAAELLQLAQVVVAVRNQHGASSANVVDGKLLHTDKGALQEDAADAPAEEVAGAPPEPQSRTATKRPTVQQHLRRGYALRQNDVLQGVGCSGIDALRGRGRQPPCSCGGTLQWAVARVFNAEDVGAEVRAQPLQVLLYEQQVLCVRVEVDDGQGAVLPGRDPEEWPQHASTGR